MYLEKAKQRYSLRHSHDEASASSTSALLALGGNVVLPWREGFRCCCLHVSDTGTSEKSRNDKESDSIRFPMILIDSWHFLAMDFYWFRMVSFLGRF